MTCQHRAGAAKCCGSPCQGKPCWGHLASSRVPATAERWQREGEDSHKRPRKPNSFARGIQGLPNPTDVFIPGTRGLWGRMPPPAPCTSGAQPHSCPEPPSSWGSPSHGDTVPSEAGVPMPRSARPYRCPGAPPARLGCPEAVPNLFPSPFP